MKRLLGWLLAGTVAVLGTSALTIYTMDPYFHYHDPDPTGEVWMDERYQAAGILRTQNYDTLLLGTSLAANYQPSWFDTAFGGQTVQVSLPNGGAEEFDTVLAYAYACQDLTTVFFGLDGTMLTQHPDEQTHALPTYLYNQNPWDDLPYLLNKDVLAKSVYAYGQTQAGAATPLDTGLLWDYWFSKTQALFSYDRPEDRGIEEEADYFLPSAQAQLEMITPWFVSHPDTQFHLYLSPYSVLFWDKMDREGTTDAMLTALSYSLETLLGYDNVTIHFFMDDFVTIDNLDNYTDHIHVSSTVTQAMVTAMAEGSHVVTTENLATKVDGLRQFVVNYDYESIFQ